ncbi:hypothetical protein H1C71_023027 [Ictidomys tridecemlineatus]|nr:hypothetical protein H1C71_023027 [Ictidomys tridecemlineatus]
MMSWVSSHKNPLIWDEPIFPSPEGDVLANSLESLVETLEPAFLDDYPSSMSTISSSSTQQKLDLILARVISSLLDVHSLQNRPGNIHSQVNVTGSQMEDEGHQVPALIENPEPMEEEVGATGPPLVLVETPAQVPPPPPPERELEPEIPAMAPPAQKLLVDPLQQHPLSSYPRAAPSLPCHFFLLFILYVYNFVKTIFF